MVLRELQRTAQREHHFTRSSIWRGFLLNADEKRRIDRLMGSALLDDSLCDLLVNQARRFPDGELRAFAGNSGLAAQHPGSSLEELAQEIALVA